MIKFQCECGKKIQAPDQWLGKRVKCPQCGKPVLVREMTVGTTTMASDMAAPKAAVDASATGLPHSSGSGGVAGASSSMQGTAPARPAASRAASTPPPSVSSDFSQEDDALSNEARAHDRDESPMHDDLPANDDLSGHDDEIDASDSSESEREEPAEPDHPPVKKFATSGAAPAAKVSPSLKPYVAPKPVVLPGSGNNPYGPDDAAWLPRMMGYFALGLGILAAGAYFIPQVGLWALCGAVAGLLIAAGGIVLSAKRDRAGLFFPVLGVVVCAAALGTPWIPGWVLGGSSPFGGGEVSGEQRARERLEQSVEARRKEILAVDSLQEIHHENDPIPLFEYKLTNKTDKTITSVTGSIQLHDASHKEVAALGLDLNQSIEPGKTFTGRLSCPLPPSTLKLIADKSASPQYRATAVTYSNNTQDNFDK